VLLEKFNINATSL